MADGRIRGPLGIQRLRYNYLECQLSILVIDCSFIINRTRLTQFSPTVFIRHDRKDHYTITKIINFLLIAFQKNMSLLTIK